MSELYENASVVFGESQNMKNPKLEKFITDRFYKADSMKFEKDFLSGDIKDLIESKCRMQEIRIHKSKHPFAGGYVMFEVYAWPDVSKPALHMFTILTKLKKEPE